MTFWDNLKTGIEYGLRGEYVGDDAKCVMRLGYYCGRFIWTRV